MTLVEMIAHDRNPPPATPDPHPTVFLFLAAAILFATALFSAGCGTTADDVRRGVTLADKAVSTVSHAGAEYQRNRNLEIAGLVKAGKLEEADKQLDALTSDMHVFWKVVDTARTGLIALAKAITAYEAAGRKDWAVLIAQAFTIGLDVQAALAKLGVK